MSVCKRSIKYLPLLSLPLLLIGCSGVPNPPALSNAGPTFADPLVYVAGTSGAQAYLWNVDFAITPVTIQSSQLAGGTSANGMVETGKTLYIAGTNVTETGSSAVLWQYDTTSGTASAATPLSTQTAGDANAAAASGSAVYVGGDDGGAAQIWTVNTATSAVTETPLPLGTATASSVTAITAVGTTVYAVGTETLGGVLTPVFWSVNLAAATPVIAATPYPAGTTFRSITAYNGTVYIAGDYTTVIPSTALSTGTSPTTASIWTVAQPDAAVATFVNLPQAGFSGAGAVAAEGSTLLVGGWGLGSVTGTTAFGLIGTADLTQSPLAVNPFGIPAAAWESYAYVSGFAQSSTAFYAAGTTGYWDQRPDTPPKGVATVWMTQVGTPWAAATLLTNGQGDTAPDSHAFAVVVPNS